MEDSFTTAETRIPALAEARVPTLAETRVLPMEGIRNVRELGGCPVTVEGKQKQVKWGLIYRSEGPAGMTAVDQTILESRNIKTVVDFRAAEEKSVLFNLRGARLVELPIDAGNLMGTTSNTGEWLYNANAEGAAAEMRRLYTALTAEAIPRYREFFALLADSANMPVLFHCSAGKDRTGMAAALLLYALGASQETIIADYMISAELLRQYSEPYIKTKPQIVPYMTVREDYLAEAFKAIEAMGGLDKYITKDLGADRGHLRKLYTE
ncbi:protein-tyrosine-phosphatase [Spirochaetia bacterium]|nr:protein-tyrosine-phosphatase [Spirochaetia bacterium]